MSNLLMFIFGGYSGLIFFLWNEEFILDDLYMVILRLICLFLIYGNNF